MKTNVTEKDVKDLIKGKLSRYFGVIPSEASKEQIYKAVVMVVRDVLLEKRQQFHKKVKAKRAKRVYYLCMEFLMGRSLKNSLYNLSAAPVFEKALSSYGLTLDERRFRQTRRVFFRRACNGKLPRYGLFSQI